MSSMKLFFLLTVVITLTTQTFAYNYERMSRSPNYAAIAAPKKVLTIPRPHGVCVAPNGIFATVSWNNVGKIYFFYSCGKLMKVVDLKKQGLGGFNTFGDCTFANGKLYVTDYGGRKVYELTETGKYIKIFTSGRCFMRITSCQNRLYLSTNSRGQNLYIFDANGREIRRLSVPGSNSRGVLVGIDGNLHISIWGNKVHTYTREGRRLGEATYKELSTADGLAMDTAGNLLIADHTKGLVYVYSPCGGTPIKVIKTGSGHSDDVKIGNDGTVIVVDSRHSKIFLY